MLRSVGAIVAGFVFIGGLSVAAGALVRSLAPGAFGPDGSVSSVPVLLAIQACVAVVAIAGCYLAARLAGRQPMRHALVLGGLGMVVNIAGTVAQWSLLPAWYLMLSLALVMPYAWLGGRIREAQVASGSPAMRSGPTTAVVVLALILAGCGAGSAGAGASEGSAPEDAPAVQAEVRLAYLAAYGTPRAEPALLESAPMDYTPPEPVGPAAASPQAAGPLQSFGFLAGSCWEGRFPNRAATDEHCFEWLHDGAFLRDRHTVRGDPTPYSGETTYAWDANAGRIVYWYIASTGSFSTGRAEVHGDAIVFPESHVSSAGTTMEILNTWTRTGPDTYRVRVVRIADAGEQELWSMDMRRTRNAR